MPALPHVDWRTLGLHARRVLANWRALLVRHVDEGRQVLRELLEEPLRFTPILEEDWCGYHFEGAITIGGVLGRIRPMS